MGQSRGGTLRGHTQPLALSSLLRPGVSAIDPFGAFGTSPREPLALKEFQFYEGTGRPSGPSVVYWDSLCKKGSQYTSYTLSPLLLRVPSLSSPLVFLILPGSFTHPLLF